MIGFMALHLLVRGLDCYEDESASSGRRLDFDETAKLSYPVADSAQPEMTFGGTGAVLHIEPAPVVAE